MPMHGDRTGWMPGALDRGGHDAHAGTPAALIRTFLERCNVSLPTLAAELRISRDAVEHYAQHGAPKWFRFALAGVAVHHGTPPEALTWLVGPAEAADEGRDYGASGDLGVERSSSPEVDGTIGA